MHHLARLVSSSLVVLGLAACSSSGGDGSNAKSTIGTSGGTLAVTSGPLNGLMLTVPANALAADTELTVQSVGAPNLAGFTAIGSAARFGPAGTSFSTAATLVMPFKTSRIPSGRTTADIVLKRQDSTGAVTDLAVTSVDATGQTVTASVPGFSTIWPVVPNPVAGVPFSTLFPLVDGDVYVFDGGTTVEISVGPVVFPGVPSIDLIEVSINSPDGTFGVWMTRFADGTLQRLGDFGFSMAEMGYSVSNPQLFAPATVNDGTMVSSGPYPYDNYVVPDTTPSSMGMNTYHGTFTQVGTVMTPAGTFNNVFRWDIEDMSVEGNSSTDQSSLWLAPDVGLVKLQLSGSAELTLQSFSPGGVSGK